eukprot:CAMPEP_0201731002 /NCGR_PEP_ID=MMETSP0593-20130828/24311_1 /ASSEMBLY_ACC=CAM_ASM_000672 /TAXON_ID=267983 /ORGANISM="Skeletonema japonicum, Strain CCMP2506" /LENGTH=41 /DNA_ID= /DNA_START= /DNA_END= /DNA_ORIENTATION=
MAAHKALLRIVRGMHDASKKGGEAISMPKRPVWSEKILVDK